MKKVPAAKVVTAAEAAEVPLGRDDAATIRHGLRPLTMPPSDVLSTYVDVSI